MLPFLGPNAGVPLFPSVKLSGNTLALDQGVGGTAALLPVGLTHGAASDGLDAPGGGVGGGTPNPTHQLMARANLRWQSIPIQNLGMSGTTIARDISTNRAWIYRNAIDALAAQAPNIWRLGPFGANDGILSTDPGPNPASGFTANIYLQDAYDAIDYGYAKFGAQGASAKRFRVFGTPASTKIGESTYRAIVWAALKAHVAALTATDPRVVFIDLSATMSDATQQSSDSGSSYTHLDQRGGYNFADLDYKDLDAVVTAATSADIRDMIKAGTYPLMSGGDLETDEGLAGTSGTVTGPGITGSIATSKVITNTTGATGITVAMVATTGGRFKIVITLAGTTTGDGKIMIQDKTAISFSGTPGQPFKTGAIFRASAGFNNFGSEWNNNAGGWGGGATSIVANGKIGANETHALDGLIGNDSVIGSNGTVNFGSSTTFTGKRSWAIFFKSGTVLDGMVIELERPFAYKISNRTATLMSYLGDIVNSVGAFFLGANYRLRPTGAISQAAGGTLRCEPGQFNMFGLTEADFATRRFYKGTVSDTAPGSGTQIGSEMSGSTWTQVFGAAAVSTGDKVYTELTDREGVVHRSSTTVTAT